ncbi:MAG: hypothetical protein P3W87_002745 [Gammaproteobacteria bacterium]|nr:hypothetical protein [Gammaproteobacteria bacterium]
MKTSFFLVALLPMIVLAEADKAPEREALKLAPKYEAHVRYKMRGFLFSLQGINEALAKRISKLWRAMLVSRGVRHLPKGRAPRQGLARAFLRA